MDEQKLEQDVQQIEISGTFTLQKHYYYFLFVNTKSGNYEGLGYCQFCEKKIRYIYKDKSKATIQTFDLFDFERTKLGYQHAKKLSEASIDGKPVYDVRFIICGGDGTIPWILDSATQAGIDFEKISIGVIPIGTGNDFSRSIGWGYKTTIFNSKDFSSLHSLVSFWNKAKIDYYDIWQIQIQTFQYGGFYQIKNQKQFKIQQDVFKRNFTNYFGIGLDARIVYSVQKNRGSSSLIRKALYTLVGAKNFFKSMESIEQIVESFRQIISEKKNQSIGPNMMTLITQTTQRENNREQQKMKQNNDKNFKLKAGYKGLVCLNCTSYMCGLRNVWMTGKSTSEDIKLQNNKQDQKFNDGKLQFMCFNNQLTLALQRITRTGVRIAQGEGPFEIKFKQSRLTNQKNISTTYMQIDGQSLKVENIKSIYVKKSETYPSGRIKVLFNNNL